MTQLSEMSPMNQRLILSLVIAVLYLVFASKQSFELTSSILSFVPGLSADGPSMTSLLTHSVVVFLASWGFLTVMNVVYAPSENKKD
jgi:hypothetical protein